MATRQSSSSNVFSVTMFSVMVAVIATVALMVVGDFDLLTASFLGPGVGVLVAVVLAILLRERPPRAPRKPVERAAEARVQMGGGADAPPRGARSDPP